MNLYTLGYQGLELAQFIHILRHNGVAALLDIRQAPVSRKPGFSKNGLSAALAAAGIDYLHLGALGTPKPVRDQYQRDGDWAALEQAYRAHLATQPQALAAAADRAARQPCCLLCFEADPNQCHRLFAAPEIAALCRPPLTVVHLPAGQEA